MTEAIREWLLGIVAAALLTSLLLPILKEGAAKRAVRFLCGLLLTIAALRPLLSFDISRFSEFLTTLRMEQLEAETGFETRNAEILASVIADKTEAYILDKADDLGAAVTVRVETKREKPYPYPYAVEISGSLTPEQFASLRRTIERELAIPEERQVYLP